MATPPSSGQISGAADHAALQLWRAAREVPPYLRTAAEREGLDEAARALLDNPVVGVAITSPDKRHLFVNSRWCEMVGYSREELASLTWAELTHPDDLQLNVKHFNRVLAGEIQDYALEKRFLRKNGEILHAEISVNVVKRADGAIKYFVGLGIDVTRRKVAEESLAKMRRQLIEAQEQERTRIGRELHDDFGQRLALLAMNINVLEKSRSRLRPGLKELRSQVESISTDLRTLSHGLHAVTLEYLGVIPGIESWCRQFGARFNLQVVFNSDVQTALPRGMGVCFFRVVMEALQNVVKHSGADRVEVSFSELPDQVHLNIRDSGSGFDVRDVSKGLGLISMRERVHLLGGTLTFDSGQGRGTAILVRMPLHVVSSTEADAGPVS